MNQFTQPTTGQMECVETGYPGPGITLGEIAAEDMSKALVLKKFGLDFCCGGKRTLEEACAARKIDTGTVARALRETAPQGVGTDLRYRDWTASFLADFIVQVHHAYVRKSLPEMVAYATKVAKVHGEMHPELLEILEIVHALDEEMTAHMFKEENILFPYIKNLENGQAAGMQMPFPTVQAPIRMMEMEHASAGSLLERARELTAGYTPPEGACGSYQLLYKLLEAFENDLHTHVHLENNILFPKAAAME